MRIDGPSYNRLAAALLASAMLAAAHQSRAATRYRLEDLGTLASADSLPISLATAIASDDTTVGLVRDATGAGTTPVIFTAGGAAALALPDGFKNGSAYGLDAAGIIVGEARADADNGMSAFVSSGSAGILPTPAGDAQAEAFTIDDNKVSTGSSWDAAGHFHAVLWSGSTVTPLHAVFGGTANSEAVASNTAGFVAGSADDDKSAFHALRYDGNKAITLDGLEGYDATFARAMNAGGDIVGESTSDSTSHALLWPSGSTTPTDLGALDGFVWFSPTAINNGDLVVGTAGDKPYQVLHGFVYNGAMADLNSLLDSASGTGWTVNAALGVNDSGVIVGWGTNGTKQHAIRLTPMNPSKALQIAGGILGSSPADLAALDVVSGPTAGRIDVLDAARLARQAAGLDP